MADFADIITRVTQSIARYELISTGDKVLVALSGGPDSVALLHILHHLQGKLGISLTAIYINHGLRPKAALREAAFCADLCRSLSIPFHSEQADIPALAEKDKSGIEETARRYRYRILERLAQDEKCHRIAVGHHRDDRVETILFNLCRGTGRHGMVGMPARRAMIIRPLYDLTREEIEAYLAGRGLKYMIDRSNRDQRFARNRFRNRIIPILKKEIAPGVTENILRFAEILADEDAFLERQVERTGRKMMASTPGGKFTLDLNHWKRYDIWLKRRVIIRLVHAIGVWDTDFAEIERIANMCDAEAGRRMSLPGRLIAETAAGRLFLYYPGEKILRQDIAVPGHYQLPYPRLSVSLRVVKRATPDDAKASAGTAAFIDREKLSGGLYVAGLKPGARFRPYGRPGSKKVGDFLTDRKYPRPLREELPVLYDEKGVVWLAGVEIDHRVGIGAHTKETVKLEIRRY